MITQQQKMYWLRSGVPITEEGIPISEAKSGVTYNDEHAHARIWNHMTGKGIAHDKSAMTAELEKSKNDKTHPLHFNNADSEGFTGGKKTKEAEHSFHAEHAAAIHTIHALATHPDFKKAVTEKHQAKVMGGVRGQVSDTWKKYGATKGATSKSDVSIYNPSQKNHAGIKLSLKKGGGSQLMSAGPEETSAVHDHAATEMLNNHPKYKNLPQNKKDEIHSQIMKDMSNVSKHLNAMKTSSREDMVQHRNEAQKSINAAHDRHPELNHYVRKEATTGEGKFGKGSAFAASHLVKSATDSQGAKVSHVEQQNYDGPRPRVALPKGEGRSGNVKSDEK
jgi:hypothetical protein